MKRAGHKHKDYLSRPVVPFSPQAGDSVSDVLAKMGQTAFQARALGTAIAVWDRALNDGATVFMGLAGAMVPAGMREIIAFLIENRYVDCLVSTGANLFHDLHETLGRRHFQGSPHVDDTVLAGLMIDRIYDTFASEKEFREADRFVADFAATLHARTYSTREFLHLLGQRLAETSEVRGIVRTAAVSGVPIYCPAIADSSLGIALASGRKSGVRRPTIDTIIDVEETALIACDAAPTAVVLVGGGTPKNFIQQTEVTASVMGHEIGGHRYAVQITTDAPHWGGLSGCTFEEAESWGKIAKDSSRATVHMDATIALPLLATALAEVRAGKKRPRVPRFSFGQKIAIEMETA